MSWVFSLIFDGIALLILLAVIVGYAKKGFAGALVHLVGYFVACAGAWLLSDWLSPIIADWFRPAIGRQVEQSIAQWQAGSPQEVSGFFSWLQQLTGLEFSADNTAQTITGVIVDTGLAAFISMILWLVLFSLLMILVRCISGKLRLINRIPVIGAANGFLGGLLGVLIGFVWVWLFVLLMRLVVPAMGTDAKIGLQESLFCGNIIYWTQW